MQGSFPFFSLFNPPPQISDHMLFFPFSLIVFFSLHLHLPSFFLFFFLFLFIFFIIFSLAVLLELSSSCFYFLLCHQLGLHHSWPDHTTTSALSKISITISNPMLPSTTSSSFISVSVLDYEPDPHLTRATCACPHHGS